jgi:glycosyltransferase involved in cell wall biosynthesis
MLRARKWGARDYYVHYSYLSAFIASIIVKVFGGRVFYWNCGETWKYQRPFFREKFERLTYRMVTFLVTGTEHLADEYARFYEIPRKKVKVMPNWVDTKRFKRVLDKPDLRKELEILQDRKVVFFVHHLSFRKGSRMILPVVRDLLKVRKDFFFVIAGSGPDEESLRSRVENTDRLA